MRSADAPRKAKSLNALLAENLARLMAERGISARQLGIKAGISDRTVANYLNADPAETPTGKQRSAKLYEVELIAEKLDVPPLLLLVDPESKEWAFTRDAMHAARLYDRLTPDQRNAMLAMLEAMQAPPGVALDVVREELPVASPPAKRAKATPR